MRIIIYLGIGLFLLFVYVRFLESTSLFHPIRKIAATPADVGVSYEDIYFSSLDHVYLNGWLIKASHSSNQVPTFVYCHGNAGNIGDRVEKIVLFHQMGVNVFIFDYRGYGRSQGSPTEKGLFADTASAIDYVRSRSDLNANKIVVYGASIGGTAAVDAVVQRPVAALILESTFTSAADMAKTIAPFVPAFMLAVKFDSQSKMAAIKVPKLFLHSPSDEIVPYRFGEKLYRLAPEPKEFVKIDGQHNNGYVVAHDVFFGGINNFLKKYNLW